MTVASLSPSCPLCESNSSRLLCDLAREDKPSSQKKADKRTILTDTTGQRGHRFFLCAECDLVFRPSEDILPPQEEKARYDLHENNIGDPLYLKFFSPLIERLSTRQEPGACGLDFGSGPSPVLAAELGRLGFRMDIYDPYFAESNLMDLGVRSLQEIRSSSPAYSFVVCTEVAEHFKKPAEDWRDLLLGLRPGGELYLMTLLRPPLESFPAWHYHRDPTHVCFYSAQTLRWIGQRWDLEWKELGAKLQVASRSNS